MLNISYKYYIYVKLSDYSIHKNKLLTGLNTPVVHRSFVIGTDIWQDKMNTILGYVQDDSKDLCDSAEFVLIAHSQRISVVMKD